MILHIEFRAVGDRWHVRCAEAGVALDEPNRMAYNDHGAVVSMGDRGRDVGMAARSVPIYDAVRFDPAGTASCVLFYTMLTRKGVRRGLARILDLLDRYEIALDLPGYSEIAADLRRAFEHQLDVMTLIRGYAINGQVKK